jgi:hypothetical protein
LFFGGFSKSLGLLSKPFFKGRLGPLTLHGAVLHFSVPRKILSTLSGLVYPVKSSNSREEQKLAARKNSGLTNL